MCLKAKDKTGSMTTRPFKIQERKLKINVDAKHGQVELGFLDVSGTPIPGFSRRESATLKPTWRARADVACLESKIVRLDFYLANARLYAFRVNP